ncbi:Bzip transcription factor [Phytophthora palmivora]|uniref:Bzip transcription factor n=1 Tax=Phytophthora palmivora TaxID=4796 RepID=A0A2P4YCC2_9STRA|nr:Bzip transcription factor [Phytophthora palmivora]POM75455.1 Bzip transcription factor [Phytophthora palmivora]
MASDNVEDLSLAVKLLGHKLDYPCSVLFVWDEETSLVVRVETDIDMATPLLNLLGNLKDVSRVLQGAVMVPNNYIDEDCS